MARVAGSIRSAGDGVPNLRVVAFEEVRIGSEVEDKPCRLSHPQIRQLGQKTTDSAGEFSITYTPTSEPPDACSFKAIVRISVFDGNTLVWHSPKRPVTPVVRFDHDLQPEPEPQPDPTARIDGLITSCGRPATGFRVTAFEQVRVGFPTDLKPCQVSLPSIRSIGSVLVEADGVFHIDYTPTVEPSDSCSFSATVQVNVFDVATLVWHSPEKPAATSTRFDHELYPQCQPGSTLVRVVTDLGQRARLAEVFVNGELRGVTDDVGQVQVADVGVGDRLAARLRLVEKKTERADHDDDSDQNWSYRVYVTSVTLVHDENGNNPVFEEFIVADPAAVQELVIRRTNALVGFNFVVSVEWESTEDDMLNFRDRLLEFSELLFNATDGQFLIERFSLGDKGLSWDEADFRVYANHRQGSKATLGAIVGKDGRAKINPYNAYYPGVWLHEFGHYGLFLRDEYEPADCWPDSLPTVICTLKDLIPGTEFSDGAGKNSCVMYAAERKSRKKFCSAHPDNPHVKCTEQGAMDCSSEIAERYGGLPEWRIWTPVSRGAIVDRLTDTGIPLGTGSQIPSDTDLAGSYIPLAAWKPRSRVRRHPRGGECPNLIVRAVMDGAPINHALVTLRTSEGRRLYQGPTLDKAHPYEATTGKGEVYIRGAHIGDRVEVLLFSGIGSVAGRAEIQTCAGPLIVGLSIKLPPFRVRYEPIGVASIAVIVDAADDAFRVAPIPPPILSLRIDGQDEPFSLDAERRPGQDAHRALFPAAGPGWDGEIVVTVFDADGNAAELSGEITTRMLVVDDDVVIESADGELKLVLPRGVFKLPTQVLVTETPGGPLPPLEDGDELLVPPHQVQSSTGGVLRRSAFLHLRPGGKSLRASSTGSEAEPAESVELLVFVEKDATWQVLSARVHSDPLLATASITRLGTFALVRRRVGRR